MLFWSGYWRNALIAEAVDPRLTSRERGTLVREIAARVHGHPDGSDWVVSGNTLDRRLRGYRARGFEGLKPQHRGGVRAETRPVVQFEPTAARLKLRGVR